jgi:hypothetical protein
VTTRYGAAPVTWLGQDVEGSEEEGQRASGGRISCQIANTTRGNARRRLMPEQRRKSESGVGVYAWSMLKREGVGSGKCDVVVVAKEAAVG